MVCKKGVYNTQRWYTKKWVLHKNVYTLEDGIENLTIKIHIVYTSTRLFSWKHRR